MSSQHDRQAEATLLYVSELAENESTEAVAAIARAARTRNAHDGLTGLLIFDGNSFAQWVEGPAEAIGGLLERLWADGRHRHLEVLAHVREPSARRFPSWRLGYLYAEAGGMERLRGLRGPDSIAAFERMLPELDLDIGEALPTQRPGTSAAL